MSIVPSLAPCFTALRSAEPTKREACPTWTGKPAKRSAKVMSLAREQRRRHDDRDLLAVQRSGEGGTSRATSVLPKPTSPQTSRSIGRPAARSSSTASMVLCWSSVSS